MGASRGWEDNAAMNRLLVSRPWSEILGIVLFASMLWGCWACGGGKSSNGIPPPQHSVDLSWTASTSTVVGYKIYRGTQHLGPYVALNSSPHAGTSFTDSTVQSGVTYYYVVNAVDAQSQESASSNEVQAIIPVGGLTAQR